MSVILNLYPEFVVTFLLKESSKWTLGKSLRLVCSLFSSKPCPQHTAFMVQDTGDCHTNCAVPSHHLWEFPEWNYTLRFLIDVRGAFPFSVLSFVFILLDWWGWNIALNVLGKCSTIELYATFPISSVSAKLIFNFCCSSKALKFVVITVTCYLNWEAA